MSVTADLMDTGRSTGPITIHDYGDQALLLEFDSTVEVLAWAAALREADLLGVVDIVPALRTVLLKLAGPRYQAPTRQRLAKLGVTSDQVVAAHTGIPWRVGFGGFAPGFAYLIAGVGAAERLNVPRQSEPRT